MSDADGRATENEEAATSASRDRSLRAIRKTETGREGTNPRFTQPVRQILMMLIVLVLVAVSGWMAYARIVPIFSANRVLNSGIFLVFLLGVLTCFWQVAQLVRSVNWIEDFATRRRNAVERGRVPGETPEMPSAPLLLAPLAALLGGKGQVSGVISTASAKSMLESVGARIDEGRDITRYLLNLLIFLGLLGTFYGLATTVPAVVETIRALKPQNGETGMQVFDKLMSGLEGQLGGMGTAFSSSLLGLAGSLVVGLLELFVNHGQNRFYRELEEWMSGFTRIGLSGSDGESLDQATIAGFLDEIAGQMSDLHEYYLQRDATRDSELQDAETRMRQMTQGIEALATKIAAQNDQLSQQFATSTSALERIAEGQERLISTAERAGTDDTATQDITARLTDLQANAFAARADAAREVEKHGALLSRLTDLQEQMLDGTRNRPEGESATLLRELMGQIREGQDRLIAATEAVAATAAASGEPADPQAAVEAQMRLRSIDQQLSTLVEEMAASRANLIADLREDMAQLSRAIRRLGQGDEA